jgi:hypothetical protein
MAIMSQIRRPSPQYLRFECALVAAGDVSTAVSLSKAWNEVRSRPRLKNALALSIGVIEIGL